MSAKNISIQLRRSKSSRFDKLHFSSKEFGASFEPRSTKAWCSQLCKKDFRETHIELGLKTLRPEVDSALNIMGLQKKIGVQSEAKVLGNKQIELNAFYAKIWSQRLNTGNFPVPPEFADIFESDPQNGDYIGEAVKAKFFQAQTENFSIFFLERELLYFESQVCCADGTFYVTKNLPFHFCFYEGKKKH